MLASLKKMKLLAGFAHVYEQFHYCIHVDQGYPGAGSQTIAFNYKFQNFCTVLEGKLVHTVLVIKRGNEVLTSFSSIGLMANDLLNHSVRVAL